jgi:alpha-ketoglutarate-dependent 2,4-dichlorophenoxyacetate dioxygenase
MDLDIRPLHPLFAAEVIGVDLRDAPNATLVAQIDAAMDRYAVVVLRDQRIEDDQQLAFARALGPLEPSPAVVDAHLRRLKHREMVDISNLEIDGSILGTEDRRRMFNLGNRLWHSDSSFKSTPAKYSMLHARVLPPEGGETEFADMRAAWDALPEATKALIEPLPSPMKSARSSRRCRSAWSAGIRDRAAAASTCPRTSDRSTAGRAPKRWC